MLALFGGASGSSAQLPSIVPDESKSSPCPPTSGRLYCVDLTTYDGFSRNGGVEVDVQLENWCDQLADEPRRGSCRLGDRHGCDEPRVRRVESLPLLGHGGRRRLFVSEPCRRRERRNLPDEVSFRSALLRDRRRPPRDRRPFHGNRGRQGEWQRQHRRSERGDPVRDGRHDFRHEPGVQCDDRTREQGSDPERLTQRLAVERGLLGSAGKQSVSGPLRGRVRVRPSASAASPAPGSSLRPT